VHQGVKVHRPIPFILNRIGFDGKAYKTTNIGKNGANRRGKKWANQTGLTTVRCTHSQNNCIWNEKKCTTWIKHIHEKIISRNETRILTNISNTWNKKRRFDVEVIQSINNSIITMGFGIYITRSQNLKEWSYTALCQWERIAERWRYWHRMYLPNQIAPRQNTLN